MRQAVNAGPVGSLIPVTAVTAILSVSLALAQASGTPLVAVVSACWFLVVAWHVGVVLANVRRFSIFVWMLLCSTVLALIRMTSAGLVQVLGDRPTMFWNVDWRYAATQAQGVARFGGLTDSLDYAGEPVHYHVGPSWIAGALNDVAGLPVNDVLLIAMPAACVVVIASCGYRFLRLLGASQAAAALGPAVLLSIPSNPYLLLRSSYGSFRGQRPLADVLTDAENWWFSPDLMQNSLFALAVGLSCACLLVRQERRWRLVLGGSGLASLLAVKPQYAIGFLAVLGLGLAYEWRGGHALARRLLPFGAGFCVIAYAALKFNPSAISFVGVEFSFSPHLLKAPVWPFTLISASTVVIVALLLPRIWRMRQPDLLRWYALGAVIGGTALVIFLEATTFFVDSEAIARANKIGLTDTVLSQDGNLDQALRAVGVVLVLLGIGVLVGHVLGRSLGMTWATALSVMVLALTVPLTVAPLLAPTGAAGYEVSEEPALERLMSRVDVNEGRWLTNDLADPAQNFARPLRVTSLTAFSSAQFYVSNVAYMGWTQPDVVQRMRDVQRFFRTGWSGWHRQFLAENGITYVVIRDRCPTAWRPDGAGFVIGRDGPWTLVKFDGGTDTRNAITASTSQRPPEQAYGLSACLGSDLLH